MNMDDVNMEVEFRRVFLGFFLTLCCGLLLVYGEDLLESAVGLGSEYLADVSFWLEEEEGNTGEEEVPMHIISDYVDLWPVQQFALLRLFLDNIGRNESSWSTDAYLV